MTLPKTYTIANQVRLHPWINSPIVSNWLLNARKAWRQTGPGN
jgi:hypothetical protein